MIFLFLVLQHVLRTGGLSLYLEKKTEGSGAALSDPNGAGSCQKSEKGTVAGVDEQ